MADQRITQLDALPKAGVAATDVLPIADISASQTKKVTAKDLVDAGLDLVDAGSIDLGKLDQTSTTKLGSDAIATGAITAAKLAADSSIVVDTTAPVSNNFEGRGYFNSTTGILQVYSAGAYANVFAGVGTGAVGTTELANGAVITAKINAAGLGTAALADDAVTTAKIADDAVTADQLATNSVTSDAIAANAVDTAEIADNAVTYAKVQNVTATDRLLGRSSAGAGDIEEIACTAAGRALLDDADAAAQRTTLGLGTIATANSITASELADDAVTAAKLADESSVDLVTSLPGSGAFVGQLALLTTDNTLYCWSGATWSSVKGAGSINAVAGDTSGIVNIAVSTSSGTATLTTSLDNTASAAQFLAGPAANAGAVAYRTITGADLPLPTTSDRGGVAINGEGLRLDGSVLEIDNDVTANVTYGLVTYNAKGLVTAGRTIISSDLPVATSVSKGAVIPGTGLSVDGSGNLNHSNSATPGTYTKVTIDSQGHVASGGILLDSDLPNHSAALLTTGTLDVARIGTSTITGGKLANFAVSKIGDTTPTADHIGQFFFNPLSRDLFLWDGNVYQPIGISVGEIVFAGTFDASAGGGTGLVASVTAEGTAIGLVAGQALPAAAQANSRYYLVVSEAGTITSGNAPQVSLSPPDIILSNGSSWTEIDVSQTISAQIASNVGFTPAGDISATNVQAAIEELDTEKLAKAGGTVTGNLLIGTAGTFSFEGASDNAFETTLAVTDPTADRTITFPDASGNIVLSGSIANSDISASAAIAFSKLAALTSGNILVGNGSNVATSVAVTGDVTISNAGVTAIASGVIVDADISGTAEIAVSKLANGTTRQLLQTDIAGTGVEWTGSIDLPGTLDVTGAVTFDSTVYIAGALTLEGTTADAHELTFACEPTADRTVTLPDATTTLAGLSVAQSYTAQQRGAISALTDGATITPDFSLANNFSVTLGGNRTLANPTNLTAGASGCIWITQDGTGSRTLAYGSQWDFTGGTAPTLTTTAGARDCLVYSVQSSTQITATLITNLS